MTHFCMERPLRSRTFTVRFPAGDGAGGSGAFAYSVTASEPWLAGGHFVGGREICDNSGRRMAIKREIAQAARLIREGEMVVYPTETVDWLGANALDAAAVRKIFAVEGRPATSPLIVHVASVEQAKERAAEGPPEAERLAKQYWPGPLTLVVPKKATIPD